MVGVPCPKGEFIRAAWDDDEERGRQFRPLTRLEAQALRDRHPQVPVWWVVAAQAAVGGVVAVLAWLVSGDTSVFVSALYGAAVVVVPGALMARGMTSRISSVSPGASAVSFMLWEMVKIGGFGADADVGAEDRAAPELAGVAGRPGAVHAGVLAGAAVAPACEKNSKREPEHMAAEGQAEPRADRR